MLRCHKQLAQVVSTVRLKELSQNQIWRQSIEDVVFYNLDNKEDIFNSFDCSLNNVQLDINNEHLNIRIVEFKMLLITKKPPK